MAWFLAELLSDHFRLINILSYHTVRAGGAAFTAFFLCVLLGPKVIARLRQQKIGQYIRQDHVENLHQIHKGKAGTPTMGGILILASMLISLFIWGRFSNRMLWIALLVVLFMGAVGFVDDYIKIKRKHNTGLSARAKFTGQILTGLLLGIYLVNSPITVGASFIYPRDIEDWDALEGGLIEASQDETRSARAKLWNLFPEGTRALLLAEQQQEDITEENRSTVLMGLNSVLRDKSLYEAALWPEAAFNPELTDLLQRGIQSLNERETVRLNRLLVESIFPDAIAASMTNLHTSLGIPGLKEVFFPLGIFYIFFVILVIVSITNAVNLTDGLDGLAGGISIVSILAFSGVAYIVSRADWSHYLFLTYVPEASELFVFGGALLGAGMGFLWFNCHPAEIFMGDTGSLALGGAIGALALLTKQELLLPLVSGMFVLEALSVVIQVISFKLTGKRVFRMAPLHHHFELCGWVETKVTMRFWIVALLFALLSLGTLKLR
ncbi:MAG: phospho-N-acetylmuramoyl-pentapeptide-transferase [Candidatus Hydrogenedentes bacterium]|jgi:phospho-N-acetylmuramoyl-pentapeptide-transferase|nr:phospho-N-acetylmuramoyl-pentapeptide-transferase [Candidatus Hydrogenedentota bacterium]